MPRGHARYVLAVMVGINFLNYLDRWVASAAAPLIKAEFRLSDFEVGLLGTAFLLVYAVSALPFGYVADRGVRRNVIAAGVAIWSVATVLSGFVGNYVQLFLARATVGIGEASYYPAGTSLLADYFPKTARGRAMSIWGAGTAIGIAVGFAGGGYVAERFGWRSAFFFTAVPGLVFCLLALTMREPLRGAAEVRGPRAERTRDANFGNFVRLLTIPTLRWTILAQTVLYFVLASLAFWLPTFLGRYYGMSVGRAGLVAGVVLVLGGLVGTLAGGMLSDRRARRVGQRAHLEVGMLGFVIAAVTVVVALLAPGVTVFVVFAFITAAALYMHSGPFTAVSQDVVPPSLRASAVTMLLLVSHVLGDSHSTADIGLLSDRLGDLRTALLATSPALLLAAAAIAALGLRTVTRDNLAMEDRWAARGEGLTTELDPAPLPAG